MADPTTTTTTPTPVPPAPPPNPGIEWGSLLEFFASLRNSPTLNTLFNFVGLTAKVLYKVSGPVALAAILAYQQGCNLPWINPGPNPPSPPPIPPIPPKPPVPPEPPAPIPGDGFRVMIIYDEKHLPSIPEDQQSIIYSQAVRDYLNAKCVMGPDGKTHEFRFWPHTTLGGEKIWQDALARPRSVLPWLILSNGKSGYEGPLPKNVDEFMVLAKKYGG